MNFNGRWVPIEVMDAIVAMWVVAAVVLALLLYRGGRFRQRNKSGQEKPQKHIRRKRAARKKP